MGLRRENNINMDFKEVVWCMNWTDLTQKTDRWLVLVNADMNFHFL